MRRNKPPKPAWKQRVDEARALIDANDPDVQVLARLEGVETALQDAVADRERLESSMQQLDADKVGAELKTALRARADVMAPDTPVIASLRQRYHVVHSLKNRLRSLDEHIETTLVDLDTLAARMVELTLLRQTNTSAITDDLQRLQADMTALTSAHDEIDRTTGDLPQ